MAVIKRNCKTVLGAALFSAALSFLYSFQYLYDPEYGDSITYTLRSFCFCETNNDLMLTLTISVTMFVQVIPLLNIFKRDFKTELWYCITRYRSRKQWFFKKTATVLLMSFISAATFFFVTLFFLFLRGVADIDFLSKNKMLFFWLFLLRFFYVAFFALLLNVISIAVKVRYIVAVGAIATVASGAISVGELHLGLKNTLNPYVHATFYFHREITCFLEENQTAYYFSKLSLFESAIYFVFCLCLIATIGLVITEKTDLGLLEED